MKRLSILLLLSFGLSQQEWNLNYMNEYGGLIYSPNFKKPYTGKVYSLFENGNQKVDGRYKNREKEGQWTEWYENGNQKVDGRYKNGEKEGQWTEWYENGQKNIEVSYKGGRLDGLYTNWDKGSRVIKKGTYHLNMMVGEWFFKVVTQSEEELVAYGDYDSSDGGYPIMDNRSEIEYGIKSLDIPLNGLKRLTANIENKGKSEVKFENGELRQVTEYYPNGKKAKEEYYKDGEHDGTFTHWYENGNKKNETYYDNGIKRSNSWNVNGGQLTRIGVNVSTIQCGMCQATIERGLIKINGVSSTEVDLSRKIAFVKFDENLINLNDIEKAISELGYQANKTLANPIAFDALPGCCKIN